jgi:hypothetical protein
MSIFWHHSWNTGTCGSFLKETASKIRPSSYRTPPENSFQGLLQFKSGSVYLLILVDFKLLFAMENPLIHRVTTENPLKMMENPLIYMENPLIYMENPLIYR